MEYKKFRVGDLFDIHPTKDYRLTNKDLFNDGITPVITNTSANNGIGGHTALSPTEKGGIITFSDTTTADSVFYQPNDFVGYPHVQGMYPKNDGWTEETLLYIVTLIRKQAAGRFNYATKFTRKIVSDMTILLPVKEVEEIDFEYMENYIRELEAERISELEAEHIRELEAYLEVTGLADYELTDDETAAIEMLKGGGLRFKEFRIGDLFEVTSPKKRFNANRVMIYADRVESSYPYVVRTSNNNGQRGYIVQDIQYLSPANSFSFGQDTATVFFQTIPYFTGDKIKVLDFRDTTVHMTEQVAIFLLNQIRCTFSSFIWGQSSFNERILVYQTIQLPVTPSDEIDYAFMETYIRAIEKLTIKNVVLLKDRIIEETKKCIMIHSLSVSV